MSSSSPRSTSPASLIPFRLGSKSEDSNSLWRGRESVDIIFRRGPTQYNRNGKEPAHDRELNGSALPSSNTSNSRSSEPIDSWSYRPSNEAKSNAPTIKRGRGSILVAASDALGLKFGRRKQPIRQTPMPLILPDVIEISAPRRDAEDEERERLRDMAAQSIFGQVMKGSPIDGNTEEGIDEEKELEEPGENNFALNHPSVDGNFELSNATYQSPRASSHSIVRAASPPVAIIPNRYRSRSLLIPSRTNSISFTPLPIFPATLNTITQHQQAGTMLYKYYHPSSLRIFALSKNWRHRFMLLSSPGMLPNRNSGPTASYLHLYKSSSGDDVEMERLEINENSVVFIAEEEVGGRKHVVKVGGVDAGPTRREVKYEEGGRTMWFLHLADPAEAQKWITVIKTSILGQRTVRAGLGPPNTTPGAVEPRGDMDVMLSMHAQGLITPPTSAARSSQVDTEVPPQPERTYASSVSSHHSQATLSRTLSSGAVSTFKGLFTGSTRPRSASRATSIDSRQDREEESFGSMGSQLLGTLHTSNIDPTLPTHSVAAYAGLPFTGSTMPAEHRLERKIATERASLHWEAKPTSLSEESNAAKQNRNNKALSLGSLSLQPPPRKRWMSAGSNWPGTGSNERENGASMASNGAAALGKAETEPPSSPALTDFTFGTPEQRPRAPSLQSVSTMASGDPPVERSSSSTKRSSFKRWSRQALPRRLTPPAGPPPSIPTSGSSVPRLSVELTPTRSRTSSHSATSHKSFVSSLPSFSKRASGSSVFSSSSLPLSPAGSRPPSNHGHRLSMPPPRPAPMSALPPAPVQDLPQSDPFPSKTSFRESASHRGFRLSMIAPKPPPSGHLPPRPDEVSPKSHRRNSSTGTHPYSTPLDVIPASPPAPKPVVASPPFPPPAGPLPPTPSTSESTKGPPSRPLSRHISLGRRLRILSAPSAPPQPQKESGDILDQVAPLRRPRPVTSTVIPSMVSPPPVSPPQTPIAEKITLYHDESSFLQLQTPVTPHLPPPRPFSSEMQPEIMSLSPPPRRGSKQITIVNPDAEPEEKPATEESEHRPMSLSRPGSVISLGIVSM